MGTGMSTSRRSEILLCVLVKKVPEFPKNPHFHGSFTLPCCLLMCGRSVAPYMRRADVECVSNARLRF